MQVISGLTSLVYYFSSADNTDDAALKGGTMILINKKTCNACYLRMKNELLFMP